MTRGWAFCGGRKVSTLMGTFLFKAPLRREKALGAPCAVRLIWGEDLGTPYFRRALSQVRVHVEFAAYFH